jgi:hypothetical protein
VTTDTVVVRGINDARKLFARVLVPIGQVSFAANALGDIHRRAGVRTERSVPRLQQRIASLIPASAYANAQAISAMYAAT